MHVRKTDKQNHISRHCKIVYRSEFMGSGISSMSWRGLGVSLREYTMGNYPRAKEVGVRDYLWLDKK